MIQSQTFEVSLSKGTYHDKVKAKKQIPYACFKRTGPITIDMLTDMVMKGHSFASIFNKEELMTTDKTEDNAVGSWLVVFDIDGKSHRKVDGEKQTEILWRYSMTDTLPKLSMMPSLAYESWSNNPYDKGFPDYRFRLVYVLDEMIKGSNEYKALVRYLRKSLGIDSLGKIDGKSEKIEQMWFGNDKCKNKVTTDTVIHLQDILNSDDFRKELEGLNEAPKENNAKSDRNIKIKKEDLEASEMIRSLNECETFEEFLKANVGTRHTMVKTDIDNCPEDQAMYTYTEDDYAIIPRRKLVINKRTGKVIRVIDKYTDEDKRFRRRSALYLFGIGHCLTTPNITLDELVYALVFSLNYYIDNTVDPISKGEIVYTAKYILNHEDKWEKNKPLFRIKRWRKRKVNPKYCIKYNKSAQSVSATEGNKERKEANDKFIEENYDPQLKIRENLEKFKSLGRPLSDKTLRRWIKSHSPLQSPGVVLYEEVSYSIQQQSYSLKQQTKTTTTLHPVDRFFRIYKKDGNEADSEAVDPPKYKQIDPKNLPKGCSIIKGELVYPIHLEREVKRLGYC